MWYQTEPKWLQCKNKWAKVSGDPHAPTHIRESLSIMPRRKRLSFVGSLSRSRHQTNNTTLRGTSLCQREDVATVEAIEGFYRLRWYGWC